MPAFATLLFLFRPRRIVPTANSRLRRRRQDDIAEGAAFRLSHYRTTRSPGMNQQFRREDYPTDVLSCSRSADTR